MTSREELIDQGRRSILASPKLPGEDSNDHAGRVSGYLLDLFEKAQSPTTDELWLNNLSYAATALESSADNGDRYCARLIREHLAGAGTQEAEWPASQGEASEVLLDALIDAFYIPRVTSAEDWATSVAKCLREAGVVASEEPEWVYGVTTKWGIREALTLHGATQYAEHLRGGIEGGRESGDLEHHGRIMRRTKAKAGPWFPLEQNA